MFEDEHYHEVFVPLPDVYDEGGPMAITEFQRKQEEGKNLVVMPLSFIDKLGQMEAEDHSYGAASSLTFIDDLYKNGIRLESKNPDKFIPFNIYSNLDMCFTREDLFPRDHSMMSDLSDLLHKELHLENTPFNFITSRSAESIKMSSRGINVAGPEFLIVDENVIYKGIVLGNDRVYASLLESPDHRVPLDQAEDMLDSELMMNQFVRFETGGKDADYALVSGHLTKNHDGSRITRVDKKFLRLIPQKDHDKRIHYGNRDDRNHAVSDNILGIRPFDMEQYLALQYGMMAPDTSLFFLCGRQGSGKTVLAYAYALDSILWYDSEIRQKRGLSVSRKGGLFQQTVLMKAPEILGGKRRDPGALPGDLFQKLENHMAPYKDAHELSTLYKDIRFEDLFLHPTFKNAFGEPRDPKVSRIKLNNDSAYLPADREAIELIYSGFAGGRSKSNTLFIVDEAQDYTPYEMKTIMERMALGSAMIILGDPFQTRNPLCTVKKNGLTYAIRNYLDKPYSALMYLSKNYRTQISEDSETMKVFNRY
jgi:predicted ribonuclease YlaK